MWGQTLPKFSLSFSEKPYFLRVIGWVIGRWDDIERALSDGGTALRAIVLTS